MNTILETNFKELNLKQKGKVRDIYDLNQFLLFVTTDRISAFDVVMSEPIPDKGKILSQISAFWFKNTTHIVKNHFITNNVEEYPKECKKYSAELDGRSMLVKKCKVLPIECIVRGYVAGSGWKEYRTQGTICGIKLPEGLKEFSKLPEPTFTPSTKADVGHDENINIEKAAEIIGWDNVKKLSDYSIKLYKYAEEYLEKNGLIIADTKFEFGVDENGEIILIDEALTPDSSRFWLKEKYAPGVSQYNFDKQVLRDYLEMIGWNKQPPPPHLPDEIIKKTQEKYWEAFHRIVK